MTDNFLSTIEFQVQKESFIAAEVLEDQYSLLISHPFFAQIHFGAKAIWGLTTPTYFGAIDPKVSFTVGNDELKKTFTYFQTFWFIMKGSCWYFFSKFSQYLIT